MTWQPHEWSIHFVTKRNILKILRKQEWWILERNKFRTIIFGNWNKTRTNSFLEMGKSSSNVPNVFKGLSLTGHRIHGYWESWADIYYIFNISSFTGHIQRFWMQINSVVLAEIFISQKWVFLPIWSVLNGDRSGKSTHISMITHLWSYINSAIADIAGHSAPILPETPRKRRYRHAERRCLRIERWYRRIEWRVFHNVSQCFKCFIRFY